MRREYEQTCHRSRQFQGQQKLLRNVVSTLTYMVNPLPGELEQVGKICASAMSLFSLARRVRQSQHSLFRSRDRYFQLHQTYYNPITYAINTRIQSRQSQRQAIHY